MIKKYVLVILSVSILLQVLTGNYVSSVKLNAMSGNNEHFSAENATNKVFVEESSNELSINKYESKAVETDEIKEEIVTREEELQNNGYEIVYENNTATELFLYNEELKDMKIIQYFEPTLVLDEDGLYRPYNPTIRMQRNGIVTIDGISFDQVINEDSPLRYNQEGIEFVYYIKGQDLVQESINKNEIVYKSEEGLQVKFSIDNKSFDTTLVVKNRDLVEVVEVKQIENDYTFSEDSEGYYVTTEGGEVRLTSLSNASIIEHSASMRGVVTEPPLEVLYDLDEYTKMLETKNNFNLVVMESFDDEVDLIIEYQSINVSAPAGERFFRGTRTHESSAIYPYGIDAAPGINNGYGVNDNYIRIGAKNFSRETGYENAHIASMGFFEDRVDYKNYFATYHVGKTVIDNGEVRAMQPVSIDTATLALTPVEIGGTASLGAYLQTYYPGLYSSMKANTTGGTGELEYTLDVIEGANLDPRSLTYDNYNSWISGLSATPASGNVVVGAATSINMDTPAGTAHKFDITNAISKWTRSGNVGPQVIRIQSHSWDLYINKNAYIELSVREMPNFAENDLDLDDTTVNVRAFTSNDQKGSVVTQGIAIDGLTSYEALVEYEIYEKKSGNVVHSNKTEHEARETYAYPYYEHNIDKAQNYYRLESNYQSEEIIPISKFSENIEYGVRVKASENGQETSWIEGDTFQIYKVGYKFETFYRIMNFYGRSSDTLFAESKIDNNMINPVISENNKLFIRNPQENAGKAYIASDLSDADKWLIDSGLMGMNLKCEYGFEPINFNNGNFFYNITDGVIFDGESRIDVNRYYNAKKDGVDSAFGRNWSSIFDAKLQILNNGSMAFADATGRVHVMSKNDDESYNQSYGEGYSFEMVEVGIYSEVRDNDYYIPALNMEAVTTTVTTPMYHYIVTDDSETKYYFNDLLQLIKIETNTGSMFNLEYNYYGVSKIVTDTNKELIVNYNSGGYISELVYPTGAKSTYKYDSVGNLIEYTDQEDYTVEYKYEDSNNDYLMTSYNMKGEASLIENTYDSDLRIVKQVDANGTISKLEYNNDHTVVTDAEGNEKKIYFNEAGYTTKVIDNSMVVEYKLDKYGNIIEESEYELGSSDKLTASYTYDGNKVVKSITPLGEVNNLDYDANGNVTGMDNGKYSVSLEYDGSNNLTKTIDPVNGNVAYEYNSEGYLVKTTDAFGGVYENIYDSSMNVVKKITPTGQSEYEYDENGLLVSSINEFGGKYTYKRNLRGEIVEVIDPYGNSEYYEYSGMGKLVSKQDFNGNITEYEYDAIGNLLKETCYQK